VGSLARAIESDILDILQNLRHGGCDIHRERHVMRSRPEPDFCRALKAQK
jgi:hypothetical protein